MYCRQIGTTSELKAREIEGAVVKTFNTQDEVAFRIEKMVALMH